MSTSSDMTDQQRISKVRSIVIQAGEEVRARYPILKHQNFIGASILGLAWAGMITCAVAYGTGYLSAWFTIPLIAILHL